MIESYCMKCIKRAGNHRHHRHLQASPSYYQILSNVVVCAGVPPELPFKVEEAASCVTAVPSPDIRLGEMHEQNEG